MIACDHCDEWFHASCLHIDDDAVERIDQFICPSCETRMSLRSPRHRCTYVVQAAVQEPQMHQRRAVAHLTVLLG